jgi:hypothetical protein
MIGAHNRFQDLHVCRINCKEAIIRGSAVTMYVVVSHSELHGMTGLKLLFLLDMRAFSFIQS